MSVFKFKIHINRIRAGVNEPPVHDFNIQIPSRICRLFCTFSIRISRRR